LAAKLRHGQVFVVVDGDFAARPNGHDCEHRLHLMLVAMTARAHRSAGYALPGIVLGQIVTAHAVQAGRLTGRAARNADQVKLVRKAQRRRLSLAGGQGCQRDRKPGQKSLE
jgi:hypothetical protein